MFDIAQAAAEGLPIAGTGRFRRSRPGPELELVRQFREVLSAHSRNEAMTLFIEPRVNGHYPDLVAVFWDSPRTSTWPAARATLTSDDLRYVHRLHKVSRITVDELVLSIGARKAERVVTRLLDAEVADLRDFYLVKRPLNDIFAVTRIIAFEAKITDWRAGLQQAFIDTWFSSEAYLLLPRASRNVALLRRADQLGVGVISSDSGIARPNVRPRRDRVPKSYASWLFNEWVWRHSSLKQSKRA